MNTQPPISMSQGRFFCFALPQGWMVQENMSMLCLTAPDQSACVMSVGLTGMMAAVTPDGFAVYALQQLCMMNDVRLLGGRAIEPPAGCSAASEFDVTYRANGIAVRGVATVLVAVGYGQCNAVMIVGASRADLWPSHANWLPQVARSVRPANSGAFGAGRIAEDNLRNSIELGQRFQQVNDYAQAQWQQVTNERWQSDQRNQFHFRENLGGVHTYHDPYQGREVELSQNYGHYWMRRDGRVVGTNDAGFDPRHTTGEDWVKMNRAGR
ncbi:MAG: hypothetical protein QM770_24365 [Tepidisphaeraceae bacterium]